jgi:hypothetical protein
MAVMLLTGFFAVGCTTYYKVTDPTTGKTYYTTELQKKGSGAATLKDGRTGNTVSLQNSEISKISKEEYDSGRYTQPEPEKPATPPAPANPFK